MAGFGGLGLNQLSDLLKPPKEDSDSDEDLLDKPARSHIGPADIGPKKREKKDKANIEPKKATKDIWEADEVQQGAEYNDDHDPRPQPEYDIIYKQAVTSEDMFLQMGNKTPATASCEDMLVKIQLPDTKLLDVKLDVKKTFLDCRTPKFKLGLHLPHPVDEKSGKAQWDGDKQTLSVSLRMTRDYDFVNF